MPNNEILLKNSHKSDELTTVTLNDETNGPASQQMDDESVDGCKLVMRHMDDMSRIAGLYGMYCCGVLCFEAAEMPCAKKTPHVNKNLKKAGIATGCPIGTVSYLSGCVAGLFSAPVVAYRGKEFESVANKRQEMGLKRTFN